MNKIILCLGILVFVCVTLLFSLSASADNGREYEEVLKQDGPYSSVIGYLHRERRILRLQSFDFKNSTIAVAIDLCLSFFCLWLALLWAANNKAAKIKEYPWFLFIFNLTWFVFLLSFKGVWHVLGVVLVNARPDLHPAVIDIFSISVIATSVFVYIWLLARTFGLNFIGAFKTFLFSHLVYFLIISLFLFIYPKQNRIFEFANKNFGIAPITKNCLLDIDKITSRRNILSLIKVRAFHI